MSPDTTNRRWLLRREREVEAQLQLTADQALTGGHRRRVPVDDALGAAPEAGLGGDALAEKERERDLRALALDDQLAVHRGGAVAVEPHAGTAERELRVIGHVEEP